MSLLTSRQFAQSIITSLHHLPQALDYYVPTNDADTLKKRQDQHDCLTDRLQRHDCNTHNIMLQQFMAAAQWLQNCHVELTEPQPHGLGWDAVFYKVGPVGLRFQPSHVIRDKHRRILPNLWVHHDPLTQFTCELTPVADMSNVTQEDVHMLKTTAFKEGLDYFDAYTHNQGWYKARHWPKAEQVVIDPDAAKLIKSCFQL